MSALKIAPQHPAYADPSSATSVVRKSLLHGRDEGGAGALFGLNDTAKGAQKIFELTMLPWPVRIAIQNKAHVLIAPNDTVTLSTIIDSDYLHYTQKLDVQ